MTRSIKRYLGFAISLSAAFLLALVLIAPGHAEDKTSKKKAATQQKDKSYQRPTDPSLYVGAETCKTCHADMPSKDFYKNYESSPHFATTMDSKKGPEWHGCEACHG